MSRSLDNPSLGMAANAHRRRFGEWPTWVRFAPYHFSHWAQELDADALILLSSVFEVSVTRNERSPRLTVGGPYGEVTYDEGITEDDWDLAPFSEWLAEEAEKLQSASSD